jgi:hypothetical protein
VVNNTFVNDLGSGGFIRLGSVGTAAVVRNNVFLGAGAVINQATAIMAGNFTGDPLLVDRAGYDYHLRPDSPCVNAGSDPGTGAGVPLGPAFQYVHRASAEPRAAVGTIDIGAYELGGGGPVGVGPDGGPPRELLLRRATAGGRAAALRRLPHCPAPAPGRPGGGRPGLSDGRRPCQGGRRPCPARLLLQGGRVRLRPRPGRAAPRQRRPAGRRPGPGLDPAAAGAARVSVAPAALWRDRPGKMERAVPARSRLSS